MRLRSQSITPIPDASQICIELPLERAGTQNLEPLQRHLAAQYFLEKVQYFAAQHQNQLLRQETKFQKPKTDLLNYF